MRAIDSVEQDQDFFLRAISAFSKTNGYSTVNLVDLLQIDIAYAWRLLADWQQAGYVVQVGHELPTQARYRQWAFTAKAEGASKHVFLTPKRQDGPPRA
jgi:hypothetical protein